MQITYQMTLRHQKTAERGEVKSGVCRDQIDIIPREWKLFEKHGYFTLSLIAQYESDFSNPGLIQRLCRDHRLLEEQSLDVAGITGHMSRLGFDYERLLSLMTQDPLPTIKTVGRKAFPGRA